ncbi:hypothetical protein PTSG_00951 [Salpingoeca rosetta]|uniref:TRPM SLOG domain-containing protein n=1 Tax=Salpingoeca rosetta (strain ATCC 50818 / BSB-021) TaxID=946362 RepID=F2TXZ0_SALR5|nr:uncharacterized protein PTSG_00951 [Salpingoeca rosetta]EGD76249.1 hypothetical protein PTSG_00951 [Salpingoeca rosetta]|eukprot:XP_004998424.1 hypothetical protein PTSG_00951 [Salpingoeca rosetta]
MKRAGPRDKSPHPQQAQQPNWQEIDFSVPSDGSNNTRDASEGGEDGSWQHTSPDHTGRLSRAGSGSAVYGNAPLPPGLAAPEHLEASDDVQQQQQASGVGGGRDVAVPAPPEAVDTIPQSGSAPRTTTTTTEVVLHLDVAPGASSTEAAQLAIDVTTTTTSNASPTVSPPSAALSGTGVQPNAGAEGTDEDVGGCTGEDNHATAGGDADAGGNSTDLQGSARSTRPASEAPSHASQRSIVLDVDDVFDSVRNRARNANETRTSADLLQNNGDNDEQTRSESEAEQPATRIINDAITDAGGEIDDDDAADDGDREHEVRDDQYDDDDVEYGDDDDDIEYDDQYDDDEDDDDDDEELQLGSDEDELDYSDSDGEDEQDDDDRWMNGNSSPEVHRTPMRNAVRRAAAALSSTAGATGAASSSFSSVRFKSSTTSTPASTPAAKRAPTRVTHFPTVKRRLTEHKPVPVSPSVVGSLRGQRRPQQHAGLSVFTSLQGDTAVLAWMRAQVEADCTAFGHISTHDRQCGFVEVQTGANPERLLRWMLDKKQMKEDLVRRQSRKRHSKKEKGTAPNSLTALDENSANLSGHWRMTRPTAAATASSSSSAAATSSGVSTAGGSTSRRWVLFDDSSSSEDEGEVLEDIPCKPLGFSRPRLVVSVTGGAKDLILAHKMRSVLSQGLHRCSNVTSTWIFTGGCNCGVMKVVGELLGRKQPSDLRLTREYEQVVKDRPRRHHAPSSERSRSSAPTSASSSAALTAAHTGGGSGDGDQRGAGKRRRLKRTPARRRRRAREESAARHSRNPRQRQQRQAQGRQQQQQHQQQQQQQQQQSVGSMGSQSEDVLEKSLNSFLEESRYVRVIGIVHAQHVDFEAKKVGNSTLENIIFDDYASTTTSSLDDNHSFYILVNNPYLERVGSGDNSAWHTYTRGVAPENKFHYLTDSVLYGLRKLLKEENAESAMLSRSHGNSASASGSGGGNDAFEEERLQAWADFVAQRMDQDGAIHFVVGDSENESEHMGVRAAYYLIKYTHAWITKLTKNTPSSKARVTIVLHFVMGRGGLLQLEAERRQHVSRQASERFSNGGGGGGDSQPESRRSTLTGRPGGGVDAVFSSSLWRLYRLLDLLTPPGATDERVVVQLGTVTGEQHVSGDGEARPWLYSCNPQSTLRQSAWEDTWGKCSQYVYSLMARMDMENTVQVEVPPHPTGGYHRTCARGRMIAHALAQGVITDHHDVENISPCVVRTAGLQDSPRMFSREKKRGRFRDGVLLCTMNVFAFNRLHTLLTDVEVLRASLSGLIVDTSVVLSDKCFTFPPLKTLVPMGSVLLQRWRRGTKARAKQQTASAARNNNIHRPSMFGLSQSGFGRRSARPSSAAVFGDDDDDSDNESVDLEKDAGEEALFYRDRFNRLKRGGELEYWNDLTSALKGEFKPSSLQVFVPSTQTKWQLLLRKPAQQRLTHHQRHGLQRHRNQRARRGKHPKVYSSFDTIFDTFKASDRTFSVMLVVEGGPMTWKLTRHAIALRTPIVVVDGTGRFSSILSYAWKFLHDQSAAAIACTWGRLCNMIKEFAATSHSKQHPREMYADIMELVALEHQVVVFDAENPCMTLHGSILKAISNVMQRASPSTQADPYELKLAQLELALVFSRKSLAERHFTELVKFIQTATANQKTSFKNDIHHALSWALRRNIAFFVELISQQLGKGIVEYAALVLFSEDNKHANTYYDRFAPLYTQAFLPLSTFRYLDTARNGQTLDAFITKLSKTSVSGEKAAHMEKLSEAEVYHHLLVWAALSTRYELARLFWVRGGNSIQNALFVCQLLRSLAGLKKLESSLRFHADRKRMLDMADKFERHAFEILDQCYKSDQSKTMSLLWCPFSLFNTLPPLLKTDKLVMFDENSMLPQTTASTAAAALQQREQLQLFGSRSEALPLTHSVLGPESGQLVNCVSLAMEAENTLFISHPAVDAVLEQAWHGRGPNEETPVLNAGAKFYVHALSFFTFLSVYAYVILTPLQETFSYMEIALACFMFDLMVIEVMQALRLGIRRWSSELWNKVDLLFCVCYLLALCFRISSLVSPGVNLNDRRVAKILLGLGCAAAYISCLRFTAFIRPLGPKLIIMGRMFSDVVVFILLLGAFWLAYAFAMISVLSSDENQRQSDSYHLSYIMLVPVFQVFGESFLEWYSEESACVGDGPFHTCASWRWLVPIYMTLFIFVSNIMLVNLLIAMFGKRYEEVEADAMAFWRRQNYDLYWEFRNRTHLPTPLSWLELAFWTLFRRRFQRNTHVSHSASRSIVPPKELERFQELETEIHHHRSKENDEDDELDELSNALSAQLRTFDLLEAQSLRLGRIEASLHERASQYVDVCVGSPCMRTVTHPGEVMYSERNACCREQARKEGGFDVSKNLAEASWHDSRIADDLLALARQYNLEVQLQPDPHVRNPGGRTGRAGCGRFPKMGPNREDRIVLTRWKRCETTGNKMQRLGQHVMEVLLVRHVDDHGRVKWCLPRQVVADEAEETHGEEKPVQRGTSHLDANDPREQVFKLLWELRGQHLGRAKSLDVILSKYRMTTDDTTWKLRGVDVDLYHDNANPLADAFMPARVHSTSATVEERSGGSVLRVISGVASGSSPDLASTQSSTISQEQNYHQHQQHQHQYHQEEQDQHLPRHHQHRHHSQPQHHSHLHVDATIATTGADTHDSDQHNTFTHLDVTSASSVLKPGSSDSLASLASRQSIADNQKLLMQQGLCMTTIAEGQASPVSPTPESPSPEASPMFHSVVRTMTTSQAQARHKFIYLDDPLNTDNAWVEGRIFYFHAEHFVDTAIDEHLDNAIRGKARDPPECRWIVAHDLVQYESADTKELIRLVVKGQSTPTLWDLEAHDTTLA